MVWAMGRAEVVSPGAVSREGEAEGKCKEVRAGWR